MPEDEFESYLTAEIRSVEHNVLNGIETLNSITRRVKHVVENGGVLNSLGELQSSATMFDADVARLATLRAVLKEQQNQKRNEMARDY